jgi:Fic family protein
MATNSPSTLPELINQYRALTNGAINFNLYNQVVHTHHSTVIKDNTLTLSETQTLIDKGLTAGGKPLTDHLMVLDHQQIQTQVLAWAADREPLNRTRLQEIAAGVMRQTGGPTNTLLGSFDSSKGEFRTVSAMAGNRMFIDAWKVGHAVDQLLKKINITLLNQKTIRQVYDFSFQAHYQFLSIHPFGAGNGRTARLLMNYMQQYHQLPLSLVYAQDRTSYINALEQSRRDESTQPITKFMHEQLSKFLSNEITRLTEQQKPTIKPPTRNGGLALIF